MSIDASCTGTRDLLDDPAGKIVNFEDSGKPPAMAGQLSIVVHFGGCRSGNASPDGGDDRYYDVSVTLTFRTAYSPADRRGGDLVNPRLRSLSTLADWLPNRLVGNWLLVVKANALIPGQGVSTDGFTETFSGFSLTEIQEAGGAWLSESGGGSGETGIRTVRINLTGARRIKEFGDDT